MGGFFGAVSKRDIVLDTFFGVDYHSHLGTKFGGMTIYHPEKGFQRQIHNITNTPFRTRFEPDIADMKGNCGIGCISDDDPQPLLLRSHLGLFAITTVGIINNADDLIERYFSNNNSQFLAMGSGKVNSTELVGALINRKQSIVEGIRYAQDIIQGSETIMLLQPDGIIVASNKFCEYWSYERVIDTIVLPRDFGLPVCSIEKEYINSASGQLRTRFQAFVESIEIKKIQEGK